MRQIQLTTRQLLGAQKYSLSYRIVPCQNHTKPNYATESAICVLPGISVWPVVIGFHILSRYPLKISASLSEHRRTRRNWKSRTLLPWFTVRRAEIADEVVGMQAVALFRPGRLSLRRHQMACRTATATLHHNSRRDETGPVRTGPRRYRSALLNCRRGQ